jgi:predicted transcriptional regulator
MKVVERITITVPDGLYERLQAVKVKLNVSRVCQNAIEQAVIIEEIKTKDVPIKDKVIERLRLEKQVASKEWHETGFTEGIEDAQELSYEDFQALEKGEISEEVREWVKDKHFQYLENPDEDIYFKGWAEGVLHFWNEIKDQL